MNILIHARALKMYPVGKDGFHGGTETYVKQLARGLATRGHLVHVVTLDLPGPEQRGPTEFWWGAEAFPTHADAVIAMHDLSGLESFVSPALVLATNGIDPWMGEGHELARLVDAYACFSKVHVELLKRARPVVDLSKCWVTGLGVDLSPYSAVDTSPFVFPPEVRVATGLRVPGRLLWANDAARGLWHLLDIYEHLKKLVPHASLHVAYDFDRTFELYKWQANALAEALWECRRRMDSLPDVADLGALTREQTVREQLECQVHAMPSDPPNVGSQIHGLTQMECAAAGCALVLSETEAFPEVFGEAATILPLPGTFYPNPELERRYDARDWAEVIAELMLDPTAWAEASRKARALAEQHTWTAVISRWEHLLGTLTGVPA